MNQRKKISRQEVEKLLENKDVLRFTGKQVTYAPAFKIQAVKQYLSNGLSTNEIFGATGQISNSFVQDLNTIQRVITSLNINLYETT